jgi:hypothetical protein
MYTLSFTLLIFVLRTFVQGVYYCKARVYHGLPLRPSLILLLHFLVSEYRWIHGIAVYFIPNSTLFVVFCPTTVFQLCPISLLKCVLHVNKHFLKFQFSPFIPPPISPSTLKIMLHAIQPTNILCHILVVKHVGFI